MNLVAFVGHLTDDPARRDTNAGVVTTFRLDIRDGKNRLWIDVEAWGHLAGTAAKHLTKGRLVSVTGKLRNRPYQRDGQRRDYFHVAAHDIVYLDAPRGRDHDAADTPHAERVAVNGSR